MKSQYEVRSQTYLPRRTYTIIRLDGKAFHTYTKGCVKPFDTDLATAMATAAESLCKEAQGSRFAYVQSDEISVLLTDFFSTTTEAWFNGNAQKIVSVSSSIVTAVFNAAMPTVQKTAYFDARVFTIPDPVEVENYFVWRQMDCKRNSIAGLAQAHFSHRELQGKSGDQMQEMLFQERGINWAKDTHPNFRNGTVVYNKMQIIPNAMDKETVRHAWTWNTAPIFSQQREKFIGLVPRYE